MASCFQVYLKPPIQSLNHRHYHHSYHHYIYIVTPRHGMTHPFHSRLQQLQGRSFAPAALVTSSRSSGAGIDLALYRPRISNIYVPTIYIHVRHTMRSAHIIITSTLETRARARTHCMHAWWRVGSKIRGAQSTVAVAPAAAQTSTPALTYATASQVAAGDP